MNINTIPIYKGRNNVNNVSVSRFPIVSDKLFPFQLTREVGGGNLRYYLDEKGVKTEITNSINDIIITPSFVKYHEGTDTTNELGLGTTGYGFSIGLLATSFRYLEFEMSGYNSNISSVFTIELFTDKSQTVPFASIENVHKFIDKSSYERVVFDFGQTYHYAAQNYTIYCRIKGNGDFVLKQSTSYTGEQVERYNSTTELYEDNLVGRSHGYVKMYDNYDSRLYETIMYKALVSNIAVNGVYVLIIEDDVTEWISSPFRVCSDTSRFTKIEYWHNEPIFYWNDDRKKRRIDYSNGFRFRMFFETKIGGGLLAYKFTESTQGGIRSIQKVESDIKRELFTVVKSEMLESIRLIPLHFNIVVSDKNKSIYVDKMTIKNNWNDPLYSEVFMDLYSNTIVSTSTQSVNIIEKGDYNEDYNSDY